MRAIKGLSPAITHARQVFEGPYRLYMLAGCLFLMFLYFWGGFGLVSLAYGVWAPGINGWIPTISAFVGGFIFAGLIILDMRVTGVEQTAAKWAGALLGGVGGMMIAGWIIPENVTWINSAVLMISLTFAVLCWFLVRYGFRVLQGSRW